MNSEDDFNYIENALIMVGISQGGRCIECEARIKDVFDRMCEECWELQRIRNELSQRKG